jgi:hypothetical protein
MKKRKIVLLVILGIIALIVIFIVVMEALPGTDDVASEIPNEYQGTYSGTGVYKNQTFIVGRDSISGALDINGLFLRSNEDYVFEFSDKMTSWALLCRSVKGTKDTVIGIFHSVYTESGDYIARYIYLGKDASETADQLQSLIEIKRDTLGEYKFGYLTELLNIDFDETYNWSGEKK